MDGQGDIKVQVDNNNRTVKASTLSPKTCNVRCVSESVSTEDPKIGCHLKRRIHPISDNSNDVVYVTTECRPMYCRVYLCSGDLPESSLKSKLLYTKYHSDTSLPVKDQSEDGNLRGQIEPNKFSASASTPAQQSRPKSLPRTLSDKIKDYMDWKKGDECSVAVECSSNQVRCDEDGLRKRLATTAKIGCGVCEKRKSREPLKQIRPKVSTRWENGLPKMRFAFREEAAMLKCYKGFSSYTLPHTIKNSRLVQSKISPTRKIITRSMSDNNIQITSSSEEKYDKAVQTEKFLMNSYMENMKCDSCSQKIQNTTKKPPSVLSRAPKNTQLQQRSPLPTRASTGSRLTNTASPLITKGPKKSESPKTGSTLPTVQFKQQPPPMKIRSYKNQRLALMEYEKSSSAGQTPKIAKNHKEKETNHSNDICDRVSCSRSNSSSRVSSSGSQSSPQKCQTVRRDFQATKESGSIGRRNTLVVRKSSSSKQNVVLNRTNIWRV